MPRARRQSHAERESLSCSEDESFERGVLCRYSTCIVVGVQGRENFWEAAHHQVRIFESYSLYEIEHG